MVTGQKQELKFQPRLARSFYLTLRLAPRPIRHQVTLAYFIARAADTIADSEGIPEPERARCLSELKNHLMSDTPCLEAIAEISTRLTPARIKSEERELLESLPAMYTAYHQLSQGDRARAKRLLGTLLDGMLFDLATFAASQEGELKALEKRADLLRYAYLVAGVVGQYWTEMLGAHFPALAGIDPLEMCRLGVSLGRGLQLINILRDLPRDLARGRCYLPRDDLRAIGLEPTDLLSPRVQAKLSPLFREITALAESGLSAGLHYLKLIPARMVRNRLAVALPVLIGAATLRELKASSNPLDPRQATKISRSEVYRILALAFSLAPFDNALERIYLRLKG